MEKEKVSKKFWIVLTGVCIFLLVIVTVSFIAFSRQKADVIEENKNGGSVTLKYSTDTNSLSIDKAIPTTNAIAMKSVENGSYFDFVVDTNLKDAKQVDQNVALQNFSK